AVRETVLAELKKAFRPEFLNRIDDTVVFHKLSGEDIKKIAEKMLETLKSRMLSLGVEVNFSEECLTAIAAAGFDPVYGARPLRRAIQNKIEDMLSEKLLDGSIKNGDKITVGYSDGEYTVNK
ncbi:MAG: ATP-dependent Clp protease ATP-binding subunit, partial [Clostridia bacterium]|nr:ATP-dependent Clp protease ATP-binding subunit [Clostridia bacterium]